MIRFGQVLAHGAANMPQVGHFKQWHGITSLRNPRSSFVLKNLRLYSAINRFKAEPAIVMSLGVRLHTFIMLVPNNTGNSCYLEEDVCISVKRGFSLDATMTIDQ